ncbi:related to tyrosinase precursor (monophenol monooxygenase) [Serendipita indica DSM 11827]|uniref:tyrosinase n=1 Tax=Serendipita indica (strain DSM 11827) TaxID=1109443 RepID=G4TM94_SERID|nr:related to tyrosinase precursor (monophenol monooxygenase) [Serendipita indica DSM 11827]
MVLTSGITGGRPVARQEIRVFYQDQDLMNLFLLGVIRLQEVDESKTISWFQIAGIHGRPYVAYDGAEPAVDGGGYCAHSTLQFPTWHRPYLALMEQEIYKCMIQVANEYTNSEKKAKYLEVAKKFPYWDWAANGDIPDFISQQLTVELDTPNGLKTVPNPLYQYKFQKKGTTFGTLPERAKVWDGYNYTLRSPRSNGQTVVSTPEDIERQMASNRADLRTRVYNLLVNSKGYWSFSHDGWSGNPPVTTRDSIESIHGNLHNFIGRQGGHMSSPDFAAFDPIFWFHHCNVDRLFAIWQDTRAMGYTYPELAKWSELKPQDKSVRLRIDVNLMYGSQAAPFAAIIPDLFKRTPEVNANTTVDPTKLSIIKEHKTSATPAKEVAAKAMSAQAQRVVSPPPSVAAPIVKEYNEWTANITVEKYAIRKPFLVHIFLGKFDTTTSNWATDPNLVGTWSIFANDLDTTQCANCRNAAEQHKLIAGSIPLTRAIMKKGYELGALNREKIVPFLTNELHWRVTSLAQEDIKREDIPSLKVSVSRSVVVIPETLSEFPVWKPPVQEPTITIGRPGGAAEGE